METAAAMEFLPVVAVPSAARRFLVVSVHDVAPSTRSTVEQMLADLAKWGVRATSLLVVPDYHHEGLFNADASFVSWLRQLETDGHEIVIHGYFHERSRVPGENTWTTLVNRFYTQGEGEFYDLDHGEALRRITQARDAFRAAHLHPVGFIAPAWLLNAAGERAAREADLEYTNRLRSVTDLRRGDVFPARSLVYSVRNEWRRAASLAWNATLASVIRPSRLARLSLHPPDRFHPRIWRQIDDLLGAMQEGRTITTYRDWIAQQRVESAHGQT